jgi:hypothetical protein
VHVREASPERSSVAAAPFDRKVVVPSVYLAPEPEGAIGSVTGPDASPSSFTLAPSAAIDAWKPD